MLRNALAVTAGFVAWTALFFGLAAVLRALFPEAHLASGEVTALGVLMLYLALTVVASVVAGFVAARVAASRHARMVRITGLALLAVGLPVQIASWSLAPAWYNVAFLLVLVPLTIAGGRLAGVPRT